MDDDLSASSSSPAVSSLTGLIGSLGSERFGTGLLSFLRPVCDADHATVFQMDADKVKQIGCGSSDGSDTARRQSAKYLHEHYWRRDPFMSSIRGCAHESSAMLIRLDFESFEDRQLRDAIYPRMRERLMVAGRRRRSLFGLSILRSDSHGAFSESEVKRVDGLADFLLAVLAKHADFLDQAKRLDSALSSVEIVESRLVALTSLPRREMEVCARILLGSSTTRIAESLGIGPESVKTYRKRIYQRIAVDCEAALTAWYLRLPNAD